MNPLAALPRDFRYGACAWRSRTRETPRRFLHMMLVIQSNADSIVRPTAFHRSKSQLCDRPALRASTFRRDWTTFRDTWVEGNKTLRVYLVIFEILEFTFLYSYHFLASFECEKAFHDEVSFSNSGWINSNWVISRRDWFWKRTFLKMGTINTKCRYRYYIDLKFFHLYVYIHLYIHTLVCIFEMKIWIYDTRVFVYLSQIHRMNSN